MALRKVLSEQRDKNTSRSRREQILDIARTLMVDEGMSALTMRGVARAAGISPGNLSYHFESYEILLDELQEWVLMPYLSAFEVLQADVGDDPVNALRAVLGYVLDDLATKDTTLFFPELWVLSNREDAAALRMRKLYDGYMNVLKGLISKARPELSEQRVSEVALFICASIEGQTVFIGYNRPHKQHRQSIKAIALDTMVDLVMNIDQSKGAEI